ncbi:MAG TPA: PIG-L family deacetylase, partial [Gemmatimonadaceae bacterium]|nr:PIG-L family deacetylase [Gemmatimonadaceae bacterium]
MKRVLTALAALIFIMPAHIRAQVNQRTDFCADCGTDPIRVLLVGAHPDDEDTNLIAWLQRGGRAQTAYLSFTRGDGGQNLIGNELGETLGIIRTEELLAARRVDGAHQFFTRAYDFGFSKSAAETYAHWPKD